MSAALDLYKCIALVPSSFAVSGVAGCKHSLQNNAIALSEAACGIKKSELQNSDFWCRWPDSNRHGIATGGF